MARQFFDTTVMIPSVWQAQTERARVFNPAILSIAGQWVFAYRVVFTPDDHRIAICRLDSQLRVQPGSVCALSDVIVDAGTLLQDPRLIEHQGRLWLYYDHYRPGQPNRMVLVELDLATLQPKGAVRPLLLTGSRQRTEKSWLLFVHADELYAVYRMVPHVILHLDLSLPDAVLCRPVHRVTWEDGGYAQRYGELRGGTPPVQIGDYYYSFFHSWYSSSRVDRLARPLVLAGYSCLRRWTTRLTSRLDVNSPKIAPGLATRDREQRIAQRRTFLARLIHRYRCRFEQRWYVVGFYAFAAQPPFAPVCLTPKPILEPQSGDRRLLAHSLNPYVNRVVFPAGAVLREDGRWIISYGINDEQAALCTFEHRALLEATVNVLWRGNDS